MNHSNVGLPDLPNEILHIILKKLSNMDVLYSLFGVDNQRLDILLQEKTFTRTLNFILTAITGDNYSLPDIVMNRFCTNILPIIHYTVKSLIIDLVSMERILLIGDYPNLTELKLFNLNRKNVSRCFTEQLRYRHIFQQITDFILIFEDLTSISIEDDIKDVYGCIMNLFKNLKNSSFIGSYPYNFPPLILDDLPLTTFFSSDLNKLSIHLMTFEDCLSLLDGRLKQLTTLNVFIRGIARTSWRFHNMDLPNLKCFSLKTYSCSSGCYNTEILPLFRRMSNLEELTLYITIDNRNVFIDGIHIYDEILVYKPRLQVFNFYIMTKTKMNYLVIHPSTDDIRRTLSNIKYGQVDCNVNYTYGYGQCHVFSLPFIFEDLQYIDNIFPNTNIIFNYVTYLFVCDKIPFKHEFFNRIAYCFPLLKSLRVYNYYAQSSILDKQNINDNQFYSIVKYPYLISLNLTNVDIDYVDQFLNERKTHLPHLTLLSINYDHLKIVTDNFTKDITRLNCIKVKILNFSKRVHQYSNDFYVYFPLLKY